MTEPVEWQCQANGVGVITLNRPDGRNSMTPELLEGFSKVLDRVIATDELRCLVVTGKGSCFSAGADFRSIVQRDEGPGYRMPHERSYAMYTPFLKLLDVEVPVIAAMNGHAVGGGFGLSLLADIRIANEDAKYGATFAKLGLHPGMGISYVLPRLVGVARAAELLFTGRLILGNEAALIGLVTDAVPAGEVLPRALLIAEQIAANAPLAVRSMKRGFYEGLEWHPRKAAYAEALAQAHTLETERPLRGRRTFEKRPPQFRGR